MDIKAVLEYEDILNFADLYCSPAKVQNFVQGAVDRITREFEIDAEELIGQHTEWVAAGRKMPKPVQLPGTYKVTINRKMAEEWASRFDADQDIPITAGTHYLTPDQIRELIKFIESDVVEYNFNGVAEYADLISASKRQIAKLEKTLTAIGQ